MRDICSFVVVFSVDGVGEWVIGGKVDEAVFVGAVYGVSVGDGNDGIAELVRCFLIVVALGARKGAVAVRMDGSSCRGWEMVVGVTLV